MNIVINKFMKKITAIFFCLFIYSTSAHAIGAWKNFVGNGELKLSKDAFNTIEFYFSTGKYGEIYNNPKYDWEKELRKSVWKPAFVVVSQNGKGLFWYYSPPMGEIDTTPNYLKKARDACRKQGQGECFLFARKDKIVWQNGINPPKGTKIKKKDAKNGIVLSKLTELGFYDGGIKKTNKIEKKKKETKKKPENDDNKDIVKQLKDLKEMYDNGAITKEEYEKAKKKLLN